VALIKLPGFVFPWFQTADVSSLPDLALVLRFASCRFLLLAGYENLSLS
jgi:hypothetical protein